MEYSSSAVNLYQHKVRRDKLKQIGFVMIEDWMIKSPPQHKLDNRKLWHRRYFVLIQINTSTQRLPKSWAKKQQTSTTAINNNNNSNNSNSDNDTSTHPMKTLNEFYLAYWQNQSDRNLGVKPIRIISMENGFTVAKELPPYFQEKFKHVIALDTLERKYYFCTRDDVIMTSWFEFLSHAIDAVKLEAQAIKQGAMPVYESVNDVIVDEENQSEDSRDASQPLYLHHVDGSAQDDYFNDVRKPRARTFDDQYTPGSIPNLFRHNSDGSRHRGFATNQNTRNGPLDHEYECPRDTAPIYDKLFESPEDARRGRNEYDKRGLRECDVLQQHIDSLNSLCIPHNGHMRRRSVSPRMGPRGIPHSPRTTARATFTPRSANCSPFMSRRETPFGRSGESSPRLIRTGAGGVDKMTIYFHDLTFEMPATSSVELNNESLHVTTDECDCYVSMLPLDDDEDENEYEREEEENEVEDYEVEEQDSDTMFKKEVYI